MRGIEVFLESLTLHGVDAIFGNPGTTENPLLDTLIDFPSIKYYVHLHEGVAVGAAGFYAQATGNTAVANLHVAPGLGNAIGMMYGALKSNSPLIVTAGQQDTRMRLRDPVLGHDLVSMAAPVTKWSVQPNSADEIGPIMRRAFQVANEHPKGPVFVALPIDVMSADTTVAAATSGPVSEPRADSDVIDVLVAGLLASSSPGIVASDDVARTGALPALVALAERTGAAVYREGIRGQLSFPNQHPNNGGRLPLEAAGVRQMLAGHDFLLLTDGPFFEEVWHDSGGYLPEGVVTMQVAPTSARTAYNFPVSQAIIGSLADVLERANGALEAAPSAYQAQSQERNEAHVARQQELLEAAAERLAKQQDLRPMTPAVAVSHIAAAVPDNVVVVDESITASIEVGQVMRYREAGDYFGARGGGIGQGLAGAIGVQAANPERPVLCISGDGSAMYSIQAFWTAAHHELPIVFLILSNREYRVLKHNLDIYRNRFDVPSNRPYPHMDLTNPVLGFPEMAKGMGIEGELIEDPEKLQDAVARAFSLGKPYVIEVVISGKP